MKIRTQFLICIAVFTMILVVIAGSVAVTELQVAQLNAKEEISGDIERRASNLNSVSIDYFLYQEDLQLSRWQSILSSLSNDLANLEPNNPQQKTLTDKVDEDLQALNTLFSEIVSYLQRAPRNVSVRIDPAFQLRWSNMAVQSSTLASDASQLSHSLGDQAHQINDTNLSLIVLLVGAFGAFLATIYLMVFRRTLKSVYELQKGINTVGSGNLAHTIEIEGQNEITELSSAFNQMTNKLKTVTASKADLQQEISERKKAEEKLEEYRMNLERLVEERTKQLKDSERLATIGAIAGMVGHDIRNPLQAMTSDVYLAKSDLDSIPDGPAKDGIRESLYGIEENVEYVNKIVQDLQDYARPIVPIGEETNLETILDDVLLKKAIPENIEVSHKVEAGTKMVNADSNLLKRILANLVNNAVQAMPSGGKLSIHAYKEANDVIIAVRDTGVGIPEAVKGKLFTPMFTTKSKGQGFGLAVVKRMTESLGGTVTFESQENKGTTFTVRFPTKKVN